MCTFIEFYCWFQTSSVQTFRTKPSMLFICIWYSFILLGLVPGGAAVVVGGGGGGAAVVVGGGGGAAVVVGALVPKHLMFFNLQ